MTVYYRLIGSGETDANGVASYTYQGTGKGEVDLIASISNPIGETSLVSETVELMDCGFYDDGITTSGGKLYYTSPTSEVSRETDATGTLITNLTSSLKTIRANKPNTTADEKDWEEPIHIEFDVVSWSGELSIQLWKSNTTGDYIGINLANYLSDLSSANVQLEYDGNRINLKINNTFVFGHSFTFVSSDLFGIRLLLGANSSIKYKDFKVYPILESNLRNCIFYDGGVTGKNNPSWVVIGGTGTKTVDNTGTTLSNTNSETRYDVFANLLGTTSTVYDFQPSYAIEMDILEHTGTARFQIYDSTTRDAVNLVNATGHWKIEYDGTTVRPYKDGTALTTYERNMPNARIGFYIQLNETIKYKNFMIYPI